MLLQIFGEGCERDKYWLGGHWGWQLFFPPFCSFVFVGTKLLVVTSGSTIKEEGSGSPLGPCKASLRACVVRRGRRERRKDEEKAG